MRILSRFLSLLLIALLAIAGTSALADEASEAAEIAESIYAQAAEHEEAVTALLHSLETDAATLIALEHRQKSQESIARKLMLNARDMEISLQEARETIHDALRYTFCIEYDEYTAKVDSILKALNASGYSVEKFRNYWGKEGYQGINVNVSTLDGFFFEIQFHTQDSYDAKESRTHHLYEIVRNKSFSTAAKAWADARQKEIFATVPSPEGAVEYIWPN